MRRILNELPTEGYSWDFDPGLLIPNLGSFIIPDSVSGNQNKMTQCKVNSKNRLIPFEIPKRFGTMYVRISIVFCGVGPMEV